MSARMCIEVEHWLEENPDRRVTIHYGAGQVATNVRYVVRTGGHLRVRNPDSESTAPRWIAVAAVTGVIGIEPREGEL